MEFCDENSYPSLGTEDLGLVHRAFPQSASPESMIKTFKKVINFMLQKQIASIFFLLNYI